MTSVAFSETMNEITGYGGFYERCCRAAVCAGAQWCMTHPGVFEQKSVEHAIAAALVAADDGRKLPLMDQMSREQLSLALVHIRFIWEHGWNEYVRKMSAPVVVYHSDGSVNESAA